MWYLPQCKRCKCKIKFLCPTLCAPWRSAFFQSTKMTCYQLTWICVSGCVWLHILKSNLIYMHIHTHVYILFCSLFPIQKIVSESHSDQWKMCFNFWSKFDLTKSMPLPLALVLCCGQCYFSSVVCAGCETNQSDLCWLIRIIVVERHLWRSSGPTLCWKQDRLAQVTQPWPLGL